MKKIVILLLSALLLTGCTTQNKNSEITFWTLQMGDFTGYINKIINEYEQEHPNVKIKWVDVPFSEGEKRTLAAVMTDVPPDLINLNPDFSALLAQKGTLWKIDEEKLDGFNSEIVEALKYNGEVYSIPWYATSAITIYNKDLFSKSQIIRLPKTYNELASISAKIKENTGAFSYLPTITENDTMIKILNKYGISDVEDYDSPQSIKIFEMYKKLYQNGLIPPETITNTHREALEQYMAGKVVFYQGGANFLNMIKENAPQVYSNTDVAEQIKGSVGQNDFSVMNFVIPARAKNKEQVLDFCLYLTNEKNQLELAKMTNVIATNDNALKNDFYNDYSSLTAKARSLSAKQINRIVPIYRQKQNQKEINLMVNTAVQSILLNKDSTENILRQMKYKIPN
ncbi:MAG: sugar ABC transporter substrate-binding protein [bacterium]|nr:sugar ABC transporter substrate-binding protein [bacterium]